MISVVIPAHNEEAVIAATLGSVVEGLEPGAEVLVVCNGCSDDTAAVAGTFGLPVRVLEIEPASKVAALNAGDEVATGFPRVYLDADVSCDGRSLTAVAEALRRPGALAAEPETVIDTRGSSLAVRAYYKVAQALHGRRPGDLGGGVYAMSELGRARFGAFPAVISDDGFAKAHFRGGETVRVTGARSVVKAPTRTVDLVRIKSRSRLGTVELQERHPGLWAEKREGSESLVAKVASVPMRLWPLLPVYLVVQLATRWQARRLMSDMTSYRWQRDDSSRNRSG